MTKIQLENAGYINGQFFDGTEEGLLVMFNMMFLASKYGYLLKAYNGDNDYQWSVNWYSDRMEKYDKGKLTEIDPLAVCFLAGIKADKRHLIMTHSQTRRYDQIKKKAEEKLRILGDRTELIGAIRQILEEIGVKREQNGE